MLLLNVHLCISADFPIGWCLSINLSSGWFLLICVFMCKNHSQYSLHSHNVIQMIFFFFLKSKQNMGKETFKYAVPVSWNYLQKEQGGV